MPSLLRNERGFLSFLTFNSRLRFTPYCLSPTSAGIGSKTSKANYLKTGRGSEAKTFSVFDRGDEGLHHFRLNEVAVETVKLI